MGRKSPARIFTRRTVVLAAGFALTVATAAASPAAAAEQHGRAHLLGHTTNAQYSSNWSGYAETGSGDTSATATWTVPSVSPTDSDTYSSAWVGIDGDKNSNLIQTGTESDYAGGAAEYSAWWEILPDYSVTISSVPVSPGDSITASVAKVSGGTWKISLKNNTTGRSWSATKTYTGPGESVEYIQEAPTVGGDQSGVADFSKFSFKNLKANGAGPGLTSSDKIILQQNGTNYSTPSNPNSTGDGFSVSYTG
ncbi:MAG TPA: G1 family glutamic endopeptidase [Amycolatopsis sp.]|uniref:G1 family glutamic endopeptidase n=1 Tax=Amycolatopsis sp. TaxID=37632 RepID=UPI002B49AD1E|nr:G1 family glutamic endopeptidase [Amycolatopsis sp.]HKS50061.1 G1 family glutamic endopeptidase [Amycolatopsis sp.]